MNDPSTKLSILDPVIHQRLLADLDGVCEIAQTPRKFVHASMVGHVTSEDLRYVKEYWKFKNHGTLGYTMTGKLDNRHLYIAGAFIRNFIDARVVSLNTLIPLQDKQGHMVPDPTVMVIPNLFVATHGKALTSWQIQSLYDLLMRRYAQDKSTIVYVESMDGLKNAYGPVFADHLLTNFC